VFERLREEHGAIKIVAISASVLDHERRRCLEMGFDAFIGKPFYKEELYACLAERLGVEYEYAGESPEIGGAPAPSIELPRDLYDQLQEALRTRNITALDRLFDAVEALGPQAAGLAAHLRELSQQYDLSSIAHVLDENGPG